MYNYIVAHSGYAEDGTITPLVFQNMYEPYRDPQEALKSLSNDLLECYLDRGRISKEEVCYLGFSVFVGGIHKRTNSEMDELDGWWLWGVEQMLLADKSEIIYVPERFEYLMCHLENIQDDEYGRDWKIRQSNESGILNFSVDL